MRLFFIISLFTLPTLVYGQACTESTFNTAAPSNTYNCSSLVIGGSGINKSADGNSDPLQIIVSGDVEINANIILDGGNGATITLDNTDGPFGGPGATGGGGFLTATPQPGGFDPADGSPGSNDIVCSSGGGGAAGAESDGSDGLPCSAGTSFGLKGVSYLTFPSPLIGGFGGGAGGEHTFGSGFDLGGGGGGGGGLIIKAAAGKITIADGVRISAKGGNGGNSVDLGGAGGGGAGGTIHLIALEIDNKGIFDVRGGNGGINTKVTLPKGGNGGAGGNGIIRFEINSVVTDVSGIQDYSSGLPTSSTETLKSSISCGTIIPKNNDSKMFFQMMAGFFIVVMMTSLLKTLSRYPKKF